MFTVLPVWMLIGVLGLVGGSQVLTSGAALSISPQKGSHAVGQVFSVDVELTAKDPVNVVGVTLGYPSEILEVLDVVKHNSLFTLWIEEPEYSTHPGTIRFSGGILESGGFTGEGKLATVLFRARKSGEAHVRVVYGEVLANDGMGTDVLFHSYGGVYTFNADGGIEFDLDGNGVVNMKDLGQFVSYWGGAYDERYDFNGNGKLDLNDLTLLVLVLVRGGGV